MKAAARFFSVLVGIAMVSLALPRPVWAQAYSHARVVRLSFGEGTVTIQRPDVAGWAAAPVNTPIQEGFKLSTAQDSYAEVEFENSSTARLGESSELDFDQLALAPSGGKINCMSLQQGYATFDFTPENDDVYEVKTGDGSVTLATNTPSRFRADLNQGALRVEVFKGEVQVTSPFGAERLSRNMVMDLRPGAEQPVDISQGITEDDWDKWVDERASQMAAAESRQAPGVYSTNVNSLYGWSDLMDYGTWDYVPGYGYGWAPFVSAGWMPFTFGRWCWLPGWGFTWISFEPWGWLPFHYGGWLYQPGLGWCWFPEDFGFWSPGTVNWFQGPGWVGWAPQRPRSVGPRGPSTQGPACPSGQRCVTSVSVDSFRNGQPVRARPFRAPEHPEAFVVEKPDIAPTRAGTLTGAVFAHPGGLASFSAAENGRTAHGVVYDPADGRYVNGPQISSPQAATKEPITVAPIGGDFKGTAPSAPYRAGETRNAPQGWGRQSAPSISHPRFAPSGERYFGTGSTPSSHGGSGGTTGGSSRGSFGSSGGRSGGSSGGSSHGGGGPHH